MIDREWWTQQWLDLINTYRFKKRLERGWQYAREGKVLSIEFPNQEVIAVVQGTDPKPYQVSLGLDPLTDEDWEYVIENMSQRAIFSAKLLAGEMPHNIEDVFAAAGKTLFPLSLSDIRSRCSCPDPKNPCKHISAVYYLLGDRFSEDPFVLFQMRGRTKEQILTALRQKRGTQTNDNTQLNSGENSPTKDAKLPKVDRFWEYNQQLESSLVVIVPPPSSETVLDILGPIPLATDGKGTASKSSPASDALKQHFNKIYQAVSQQAVLAALKRSEGD
ncbi:SWIM zinc finger family protein [Tychonema sp. BBK16]|uniref:SWIM zinc finger family protein n=1 Tax=Tychonema sp. BBK16 TaxID=2699888 RepID=UPI001F460610|nr:SWIM zinc finger family protein [Tychonema sp. BBK16]MCF6373252.1 SWIM zinc finger family protein [Tychonema sp. BBK16]